MKCAKNALDQDIEFEKKHEIFKGKRGDYIYVY